MKIGLKRGDKGAEVKRLHRALAAAGLRIDAGEFDREEFGPSTLDALHALQKRRGLPPCDETDESTLLVLNEFEENVTINIYEDKTTPPTPPPDEHHGVVRGTLVNADGAPLPGTRVSLFSLQVRAEQHLGDATTGKKGQYSISYQRASALSLVVRAYDEMAKVIAQSPTQFAAAAQIQVDLTTAPDGVIRPLSLYSKLSAAIAAQLHGTPFSDLKENSTIHELRFLAGAIGASFDDVASLFIAHCLGTKDKIRDTTFFGIFHQNIPSSLDAALANLPEAGIDATFISQVLSGVLANSRATLEAALTQAVSNNILPASYASVQESELTLLDGLRVNAVGNTPYVRGKTSLNDLLAAGAASAAAQAAFVQAYAANNGQIGPTWTQLRQNKNLTAADFTGLNTILNVGELLTGNLPLVKDTLNRLSTGSLSNVQNLALLDESDWVARITQVDPEASSIPQVIPSDTPQQRIARFAESLYKRFSGRYPTTAFAGGLSKAASSSFQSKVELTTFLTANPALSFKTTNVDQFLATNKLTMSAAALADLKTAQRLFRISPHYTTVEALNSAGYTSAQSVYFAGRAPFLAQMTSALGSASLAKMAYARSQMMYATSLMAFGRYNQALTGINLAVTPSPAPDPSLIASLPDLQALFGNLDYFQCDDCQSVYSPAAYLVDLLQYLSWFKARGGGVSNARDALSLRRPDIQYIALDCNNTNTTLPYIDLVNELLESVIAPPATPVTVIDTTGTSAERRALPQNISQQAYANTASAVFPLILPFDLPFAQTSAYLSALGSSRAAMLTLLAGNPANPAMAPAIAATSLGVNPEMQAVIDGTDGNQPWQRWGFSSANPSPVYDPKTQQPYSPNPADWVAAMSKVPVFMNRANLSLQQLYQLLEVIWVTQGGVTLQAGTTTYGGIDVLSPDTDDMVFTGLTADVLDRANRFLRLWTSSGLQMWELDWALAHASSGVLDDSFLIFLSGGIAVAKQLSLPMQEALTFWMQLETRDVTNHLGDEDVIQPSTYSEVFRNAAVLASWSAVFVPVNTTTITAATNASPIAITTAFPHGYQTGQQVTISGAGGNTAANGTFTITVTDASDFTLNGSTGNGVYTNGGAATGILSGNVILPPSSLVPTAEQNAIGAALALSPDDISAILSFTGAANTLSLDTLNVLLRYQRLSSSLSLDVSDLILWIQLTDRKPFGSTPADTIEFCRRLAVLQATGLAAVDLDYLLRNQSVTQSSLTFTATAATAVLQAIRDAVAKLPTPLTISVAGASNASPITITTALPNGLQTGAQVTLDGVLGNTAANGTFTITVTGPTSFQLDGTTGNGAWTSGGTIRFTAYDATTIQTIFVTALATATGTTANVVTPVLLNTSALPLDSKTIAKLISESTPSASDFPVLISAFTSAAKAAALFTALKPTETEFAFAVQNAGTFEWLDASGLPLSPVTHSPYARLEALVRAFKLDQRQPARYPRLFDVLGGWLSPGPLPGDLPTAIGGPALVVAGATDASPIEITTASPHNLQTGAQVTITGVTGNTAANGTFTITVTGASKFTLGGSAGNGVWITGGSVVAAGQPCIAAALNANVADVTAIAQQLGATPPGITPASLPGSLTDMAMLAAIAAALDATVKYGISGTTLVQLAAIPATAQTASAAMSALQAQYSQANWFGAIQPVEDTLRQNRRDALVAYLLGPGPATPVPPPLFFTTDDIFNYYLIDPEMCPCASMTRLLQASLAIQQFVQQCFLNLFFSGVSIDMSDSRWTEWSWRQQYRLWEANREVFLYPENYVLPETRTDASSFFSDLENDLRQANCDADLAETAIQNYLRKLVGVARLRVAAHYNQTNSDGSTTLHVFACTNATPPQWWYRTRNTPAGMLTGSWTAWQSLNLDIAGPQILPVIWDQRLYLVWPIFKQISQAQRDQSVPSGGGGSSPAPRKFWTIEFAMSELSAGQWQAKQTYTQKMYFTLGGSPLAFTIKGGEDSNFNLKLNVYWAGGLMGIATLPMPESTLSAEQYSDEMPSAEDIDLSQEPTYQYILQVGSMSGSAGVYDSYGYNGQDLVPGNFSDLYPGSRPLSVLAETNNKGALSNVELLGTITNQRIVVPMQEPVLDSADPFFVADDRRTYLVQPTYWTLGSRPQELTSLTYISQWNTRYIFETFYHPYARTFLRELEIGGVPQLMARSLQTNPQPVRGWTPNFDFNALYDPQPAVARPWPGTAGAPDPGESGLDFSTGDSGAYALYNWEIFYHIPMFVSSLLLQNQQFQDALTWLEYIFNPTDNSGGPAPQRFWEMAPFNAMNASDWLNQQIQNILTTLAADTQQGISDPSTANAITNWMNDPFDPHAIASTRISAYGKATVMAFLNTLIAWGDWYYAQYTAEMVSQAEQLYILADMILGPQPQMLRLPGAESGASTTTYASLKNIDAFSNVLVNIENVVVAPEPPTSLIEGTTTLTSLPQFPGSGDNTLLFCIPPNSQLLAYWDTVSQRLYNIRNCLNLQGVAQPLPLYAPPINPLALIEAAESGASFSSATPPAPIYRFSIYLQKALDLTNDVRAYGALILSALEKQDAENFAVLRANQELDIQTRMLDVKTAQVTEAQDQITALQNQLAVVQVRYTYYSSRPFMNPWEIAAVSLQGAAIIANGVAIVLDMTSGVAHMVPTFEFGAAGFGGSPTLIASFGGENVASATSSWATVARGLAGILSEAGGISATMGSYQRRQDDWTFQTNLASAEMTQVQSQITSATDRLNIANKELSIQNEQIVNAQAISTFLTNKYTNAQLYNWMLSQLTTVYTQAYQLAFSLALQAQNAYQYELGSQDTFIQFGYWDSQYKGLTAGESLLFDLRRMEAQYIAENSRELEITKHISLALTSPAALVTLRETGTCQIALDEVLFEYDYPGQYFRRLRSVALTIPCITGPYTGVHATLSLTSAMLRTQPATAGYKPQPAGATNPVDSTVIFSPSAASGTSTIATSTAQNDAGLFDVNLRDERWLPFEGQGAISTWNLVLDQRDNNIDFTAITDVILHVRYTARGGGDQTAANNVRAQLKPSAPRSILASARNTFPNAFYTLFNPPDATATSQTLSIQLSANVFPLSNLGTGNVKITDITFYVVLTGVPASGNNIDAATISFNGGTPVTLKLDPSPLNDNQGNPIAALTADFPVSPPALVSQTVPQTVAVTVPSSGIPSGLAITVTGETRLDPNKVEDILMIITYEIS